MIQEMRQHSMPLAILFLVLTGHFCVMTMNGAHQFRLDDALADQGTFFMMSHAFLSAVGSVTKFLWRGGIYVRYDK